MEQRKTYSGTAIGDTMPRRSTSRRSARRIYGSALGLGLAGILLAPENGAAQWRRGGGRLSVRPHQMATGTQNAQAGEQQLESPKGPLVYVPPQAVGARRVPLVVFLPGGGQDARELMQWHRPLADKYGMIVLALTHGPAAIVDSAMAQVLRTFAIDPDKIALAGSSNGAHAGYPLGRANLDVFSRLAMLSWFEIDSAAEYPPNTTTQLFSSAGGPYEVVTTLKAGRAMRSTGHAVEEVLVLKSHAQRLEDYDHMWSWLQESWGTPSPADRIVPRGAVIDPVPILTVEALTRMTAFWTSFMKKPDLVRTFGRQRRNQQQFTLPVGQHPMRLRMMEMAALAAKYPPVAADLKSAGLSAQQHDAYRVAIISATVNAAAMTKGVVDPPAATSVLAKNIALIRAGGKELAEKLDEIGMWEVP